MVMSIWATPPGLLSPHLLIAALGESARLVVVSLGLQEVQRIIKKWTVIHKHPRKMTEKHSKEMI